MAQDDIQGQVVDGSGNPVSGAIVELTLSYQASPTDEQVVRRVTTDSNGNYIFDYHPDGDGTTQEWHVSAYSHDGTAYVNSFNNPGVTAELPSNAIPDSVEYQFSASSVSDGSDWTSEGGGLTLSANGTPTVISDGKNGEPVVRYDTADWHGAASVSIPQPFGLVVVYRPRATGQNSSRGVGDDSGDRAFLDHDGAGSAYQTFAESPGYFGSVSTDTNYHIHAGYFDGANSENRVDGATDGTADVGSISLDSLQITSSDTDIDVAEFWVLSNTTLSDVQESESHLNNKYAVF